MKKLSVLGSTGSIGINTLKVVSEFAEEFTVIAMAAGRNLTVFADQIIRYRPKLVSVADQADVPKLRSLLRKRLDLLPDIEIVFGVEGLKMTAAHPDTETVLCAISGSAGLIPALEGIRNGKQIALATKEALVMAGEIMIQEAKKTGAQILPIDSEHNAIHQCLRGEKSECVRRLILTASGGPFRTTPIESFDTITLERALKHPTWKMGRKVTIDSATLMNKGLEVIEAHWLFDVPTSSIEVLIHPQSAVHSLVEMIDGSVIAQLGIADMRVAIQYALMYPTRRCNSLPALDLTALGRLDFEPPDLQKFPCIQFAYDALGEGGSMPTVMNAANEVAVEAFLAGQIRFTEIAALIEKTMHSCQTVAVDTLATVLEADVTARRKTREFISVAT